MSKRTRRPVDERFWEKVAQDDECWRWTGAIGSHGYGNFWDSERYVRAHRWAYTSLRGEIPDELMIDHLCRNRWCVNPWHLEPVTCSVNLERIPRDVRDAAFRPERCKSGHLLDEANTYVQKKTGYRYCRTCQAARRRAFQARREAASWSSTSPAVTP